MDRDGFINGNLHSVGPLLFAIGGRKPGRRSG